MGHPFFQWDVRQRVRRTDGEFKWRFGKKFKWFGNGACANAVSLARVRRQEDFAERAQDEFTVMFATVTVVTERHLGGFSGSIAHPHAVRALWMRSWS